MNADVFVVFGLVTLIFHLTKSKAFNKIYMHSEIILEDWRATQYIINIYHQHYNRMNVCSYQEYSNHCCIVLTILSCHAFQTASCSEYLFRFLEICQPSYFCFSGCHPNHIFNICFRKFNTCCWKKEHGEVSVIQPHLISCWSVFWLYLLKLFWSTYLLIEVQVTWGRGCNI